MATNDNTNPGTEGDQVISGTTGSDTLTGAFGSDTITGGDGADLLSGDGPVEGAWHFETFDYDFTSAAGQAFDIESGVRTASGYVSDFNEGGLTNTVRATSGNPEDFGVIYTSTLNTTAGGTYRLTTSSDDGSTIQIFDSAGNPLSFANQTGGTLDYLNNDFHQGTTTRFGDVVLDPNETYTIQIRYWENLGQDSLAATISGPDTGNVAENLLTTDMIGMPPGPEYSVTGTPAGVDGDDSIDGGAGDDTITGDGGNDTLLGGTGNDSVAGGVGDDSISGGAGDDTLVGGADTDSIDGGSGNDSITGGDGDDTLEGGAGSDDIDGGAGNDSIVGDVGPANTVLYADDFEGGVTGWSDNTTSTDPDLGTSLGRFGNGDGVVATQRTFDLGPDSEQVQIEFDALLLDSWDSEDFVITLNGSEVRISHASGDTSSPPSQSFVGSDGATYTIDFTNTATGDLGYTSPTGPIAVSSSLDTIMNIVITIDTPPESLTLGLGSELNSSLDNESFAIDNFSVSRIDALDDTLTGGAGADTIEAGNGDNVVDGGTEADSITAGTGADSIVGGVGADTIDAGDGNNTIDGGTDADSIISGAGDDSILGGAGDDTIASGAGSDTIDAGTGDNVIDSGAGADSILSSTGADSVAAGAGNDSIDTGAGDDTVDAGTGDDTVDGGLGNDILTGGVGDDVFVYTAGDGNDTITDFNLGNTGDVDDGDQSNNDFIDLSSFYGHIAELRGDLEDDGILNQSIGNYSDSTAMGGSLTLTGVGGGDLTFDNINVACFTAGAMIQTGDGPIAVENLRRGMRLKTLDNGNRPVRAVLRRTVDGRGDLAPICITAGALDNTADLLVSPAHRMFISDWRAEMLFGLGEVLVGAVNLVRGDLIYRAPQDSVTYYHILLDRHEIIFANDAATESFHLSREAVDAAEYGDAEEGAVAMEIARLFPELLMCASTCARPVMKGYEARALAAMLG